MNTISTDIAQYFFEHADRIKKLAEMTEAGHFKDQFAKLASHSQELAQDELDRAYQDQRKSSDQQNK
jgi:hypothetical protein